MRILVIAAHPDDEVLGCGGTIATLAKEHSVFVGILGEGHTSRDYGLNKKDFGVVSKLKKSSEEATELLKAEELFMFNLPDNQFDTKPLLEIIKIIEELIEKVKPEIIFTHHRGDLNNDHVLTYKATVTATRPFEGSVVKTVYAYEVPSSTEWSFGESPAYFKPNTFVDISDTLGKKIAAMQAYKSEIKPFPHPRSEEALRALASWRGSTAGLRAAEAFELIREVKLF